LSRAAAIEGSGERFFILGVGKLGLSLFKIVLRLLAGSDQSLDVRQVFLGLFERGFGCGIA
jgi:hypothetical protein